MAGILRLIDRPGFWPWAALVALSAVLHLYLLDARPFHSDEAIHAVLSLKFAQGGGYRYDPTYHGPLLYYLTATIFWLFGDSDFAARLPAALCGIALTAICARLNRCFDARTAWWTGLLITISPLFLYYGRFLRMDILEVLLATLAFFALYDAVNTGRLRAWVRFGAWTALAFATKENAWVTALLAALTLGVLWLFHRRHLGLATVTRWLRGNRAGIIGACSIWVVVSILAYTVFYAHPGDWFFPSRAIGYWAEQHRIERVAGPWWYHLMRLVQYEFLVLGCATAWLLQRPRLGIAEFCLFVFGLLSIVAYAWLGEKTPWLAVHQTWALLPLAGAWLARTFGAGGGPWCRAVAVTAIAATVLVSLTANFVLVGVSPDDRRVESLHYGETTSELKTLALSTAADPPAYPIAVQGNGTWPLAWYWRHLPVRWSVPPTDTAHGLVLADLGEFDKLWTEKLQADTVKVLPVRGWWQPEHEAPQIDELIRYLVTRKPWITQTFVSTFVMRLEHRRTDEDATGAP